MTDSMDDRRKALEEDYFRRREQEALQKLREKMQSETSAATEAGAKETFGCPKCDGTLVEVGFENLHIDRCDTCGGVWLDTGELETLTTREQTGWLSRMRQNLAGEPRS